MKFRVSIVNRDIKSGQLITVTSEVLIEMFYHENINTHTEINESV